VTTAHIWRQSVMREGQTGQKVHLLSLAVVHSASFLGSHYLKTVRLEFLVALDSAYNIQYYYTCIIYVYILYMYIFIYIYTTHIVHIYVYTHIAKVRKGPVLIRVPRSE
jgi:hypothetical protein